MPAVSLIRGSLRKETKKSKAKKKKTKKYTELRQRQKKDSQGTESGPFSKLDAQSNT